MPTYSLHPTQASVLLSDAPLGYSPPRGPSVNLQLRSNHREENQPQIFTFANFGAKWTFNWGAYLEEVPWTYFYRYGVLQYAMPEHVAVHVPQGGVDAMPFPTRRAPIRGTTAERRCWRWSPRARWSTNAATRTAARRSMACRTVCGWQPPRVPDRDRRPAWPDAERTSEMPAVCGTSRSCILGHLEPHCECKPGPGGCFRLKLSPTYTVQGIYIREDLGWIDSYLYTQDFKLRHELDHYKAVRQVLEGSAREDGLQREGRTYRTEGECNASCKEWMDRAVADIDRSVSERAKYFKLWRRLGF